MDRGQIIIGRFSGRPPPTLKLPEPLPTIIATVIRPGLCSHPDVPDPLPLQGLCQALVLRGVPDAALQLRWPDQTPAALVGSIHECAAAPAVAGRARSPPKPRTPRPDVTRPGQHRDHRACEPITRRHQMARKPRGEAAQAIPPDRDDAIADTPDEIAEDPRAAAIELAAKTLTGDMRDFILDRLRHEQSKRPWHERSEADQRDVAHQVEVAVREFARSAVELIAGAGKRSIRARLDQVVVKEGFKATILMSRSDPERHNLLDAVGSDVLLTVADPEEFTGERAPVAIRPDQAELIGDAMAVHADTRRGGMAEKAKARVIPGVKGAPAEHTNGASPFN